MDDWNNPKFAFCLLPTSLILKFVNGKLDANAYLKRELANRGVNLQGTWVGHERSEELLLTSKDKDDETS